MWEDKTGRDLCPVSCLGAGRKQPSWDPCGVAPVEGEGQGRFRRKVMWGRLVTHMAPAVSFCSGSPWRRGRDELRKNWSTGLHLGRERRVDSHTRGYAVGGRSQRWDIKCCQISKLSVGWDFKFTSTVDVSKKVIIAQYFSLNAKIIYKSPLMASVEIRRRRGKEIDRNGYGPLNAVLSICSRDIWRCLELFFWLVQSRRDAPTGIQLAEARDAANIYPIIHRIALPIRNYPAPNVSSIEVKPWAKVSELPPPAREKWEMSLKVVLQFCILELLWVNTHYNTKMETWRKWWVEHKMVWYILEDLQHLKVR